MRLALKRIAGGLTTATAFALLALVPQSAPAQEAPDVVFTPVYSLGTTQSDGAVPQGGLVEGAGGDLYGTTNSGGYNTNLGTLYKVTPLGTETVLHRFGGSDGAVPIGSLVEGLDGNFYGTTQLGGATTDYGYGTVFQLTPSGQFTSLYSFGGTTYARTYEEPYGSLIPGPDGNLYGTTVGYYGSVFEITPSGDLTIRHAFDAATDGETLFAGLVLGPDGNFYGMASSGGANGTGTIYQVTPPGAFTTLYSFSALPGDNINADGAYPRGSLVVGPDGSLYGTTPAGGANGAGTAFQVTTTGAMKVLHNFSAPSRIGNSFINSDGYVSFEPMILGTDGNFYGTTNQGGANGTGTVFRLTPSGTLTTLYAFSAAGTSDGDGPRGTLLEAHDGTLYGTTESGGARKRGAVFALSLPALTGNPTPVLTSVSVTPSTLTGNSERLTGTVTLNPVAPVGVGARVALASSDPSVVKVPRIVQLLPSSGSAGFKVTTYPVTTPTIVTITATYNGVSATTPLTVTPMPATPAIAAVVLSPATRMGGIDTGDLDFVYLTGDATSDTEVTVASSNSRLANVVGTPLTVHQGFTRNFFHIVTANVASPQTVTITATLNGVSQTAALTVTPAPVYVKSVTLSPQEVAFGAITHGNRVHLNGSTNADTTIFLTSSNPAAASVPSQIVVKSGYSSRAFTVTAGKVTKTTRVTITAASPDGPSQSAVVTVSPVSLRALVLTPATLEGGHESLTNRVYINGNSPANTVVTITNSNPSAIVVTAAVTVLPGKSSQAFLVYAQNVTSRQTATLTASYGGITKTAVITVTPVPPDPALQSVTLVPATIQGGKRSATNHVDFAGEVTETTFVYFTSSNPSLATVPKDEILSQGASTHTFPITTTAVTAAQTVTITATCNGVTQTAALIVTP